MGTAAGEGGVRTRRRSPWIAPSFMLGGDAAATGRPNEGEPNRYLRGAVHRHGWFDWRWSVDTRGAGLSGPTRWFTTERGRCLTFIGAVRELRRWYREVEVREAA